MGSSKAAGNARVSFRFTPASLSPCLPPLPCPQLTGLTSLALTARWRQRATPLPDALACLSGLVHLRISHGLQQVPPCITGLTQLTFLDLSFNAIKTIKPGPYLKQLVVSAASVLLACSACLLSLGVCCSCGRPLQTSSLPHSHLMCCLPSLLGVPLRRR